MVKFLMFTCTFVLLLIGFGFTIEGDTTTTKEIRETSIEDASKSTTVDGNHISLSTVDQLDDVQQSTYAITDLLLQKDSSEPTAIENDFKGTAAVVNDANTVLMASITTSMVTNEPKSFKTDGNEKISPTSEESKQTLSPFTQSFNKKLQSKNTLSTNKMLTENAADPISTRIGRTPIFSTSKMQLSTQRTNLHKEINLASTIEHNDFISTEIPMTPEKYISIANDKKSTDFYTTIFPISHNGKNMTSETSSQITTTSSNVTPIKDSSDQPVSKELLESTQPYLEHEETTFPTHHAEVANSSKSTIFTLEKNESISETSSEPFTKQEKENTTGATQMMKDESITYTSPKAPEITVYTKEIVHTKSKTSDSDEMSTKGTESIQSIIFTPKVISHQANEISTKPVIDDVSPTIDDTLHSNEPKNENELSTTENRSNVDYSETHSTADQTTRNLDKLSDQNTVDFSLNSETDYITFSPKTDAEEDKPVTENLSRIDPENDQANSELVSTPKLEETSSTKTTPKVTPTVISEELSSYHEQASSPFSSTLKSEKITNSVEYAFQTSSLAQTNSEIPIYSTIADVSNTNSRAPSPSTEAQITDFQPTLNTKLERNEVTQETDLPEKLVTDTSPEIHLENVKTESTLVTEKHFESNTAINDKDMSTTRIPNEHSELTDSAYQSSYSPSPNELNGVSINENIEKSTIAKGLELNSTPTTTSESVEIAEEKYVSTQTTFSRIYTEEETLQTSNRIETGKTSPRYVETSPDMTDMLTITEGETDSNVSTYQNSKETFSPDDKTFSSLEEKSTYGILSDALDSSSSSQHTSGSTKFIDRFSTIPIATERSTDIEDTEKISLEPDFSISSEKHDATLYGLEINADISIYKEQTPTVSHSSSSLPLNTEINMPMDKDLTNDNSFITNYARDVVTKASNNVDRIAAKSNTGSTVVGSDVESIITLSLNSTQGTIYMNSTKTEDTSVQQNTENLPIFTEELNVRTTDSQTSIGPTNIVDTEPNFSSTSYSFLTDASDTTNDGKTDSHAIRETNTITEILEGKFTMDKSIRITEQLDTMQPNTKLNTADNIPSTMEPLHETYSTASEAFIDNNSQGIPIIEKNEMEYITTQTSSTPTSDYTNPFSKESSSTTISNLKHETDSGDTQIVYSSEAPIQSSTDSRKSDVSSNANEKVFPIVTKSTQTLDSSFTSEEDSDNNTAQKLHGFTEFSTVAENHAPEISTRATKSATLEQEKYSISDTNITPKITLVTSTEQIHVSDSTDKTMQTDSANSKDFSNDYTISGPKSRQPDIDGQYSSTPWNDDENLISDQTTTKSYTSSVTRSSENMSGDSTIQFKLMTEKTHLNTRDYVDESKHDGLTSKKIQDIANSIVTEKEIPTTTKLNTLLDNKITQIPNAATFSHGNTPESISIKITLNQQNENDNAKVSTLGLNILDNSVEKKTQTQSNEHSTPNGLIFPELTSKIVTNIAKGDKTTQLLKTIDVTNENLNKVSMLRDNLPREDEVTSSGSDQFSNDVNSFRTSSTTRGLNENNNQLTSVANDASSIDKNTDSTMTTEIEIDPYSITHSTEEISTENKLKLSEYLSKSTLRFTSASENLEHKTTYKNQVNEDLTNIHTKLPILSTNMAKLESITEKPSSIKSTIVPITSSTSLTDMNETTKRNNENTASKSVASDSTNFDEMYSTHPSSAFDAFTQDIIENLDTTLSPVDTTISTKNNFEKTSTQTIINHTEETETEMSTLEYSEIHETAGQTTQSSPQGMQTDTTMNYDLPRKTGWEIADTESITTMMESSLYPRYSDSVLDLNQKTTNVKENAMSSSSPLFEDKGRLITMYPREEISVSINQDLAKSTYIEEILITTEKPSVTVTNGVNKEVDNTATVSSAANIPITKQTTKIGIENDVISTIPAIRSSLTNKVSDEVNSQRETDATKHASEFSTETQKEADPTTLFIPMQTTQTPSQNIFTEHYTEVSTDDILFNTEISTTTQLSSKSILPSSIKPIEGTSPEHEGGFQKLFPLSLGLTVGLIMLCLMITLFILGFILFAGWLHHSRQQRGSADFALAEAAVLGDMSRKSNRNKHKFSSINRSLNGEDPSFSQSRKFLWRQQRRRARALAQDGLSSEEQLPRTVHIQTFSDEDDFNSTESGANVTRRADNSPCPMRRVSGASMVEENISTAGCIPPHRKSNNRQGQWKFIDEAN